MNDDTTKYYFMVKNKGFERRSPVTRGNTTINSSKCGLNKNQVIELIRAYRTRIWQFRECGGTYCHMAEAIRDYQQLKSNGIIFPPMHRTKTRKD